MPYYKNTNNDLYFLDNSSDVVHIPATCVAITDAEAAVMQADHAATIPNADGFIQAMKTGLGGIVAANAFAKSYPLFTTAVAAANWPDVQTLIIDAHTTTVFDAAQYAAVKASAAANNIPITLP